MKAAVVLISLLSLAAAQIYRNTDSTDDDLNEQFRMSLRERLRVLVRQRQLEQQQMETERAVDASLKKHCDQNGPPDAYDKFQVALQDLRSCVHGAMTSDDTPAQPGIREAARKVCRTLRPLGACLIKLGDAAQPCMTPERRRNMPIANITHSAISYACDDDASRLRTFIAGDGVECFKSNVARLKQCLPTTNSNEVITSIENSIESGEVTESDCQKVAGIEQCMVRQLQTCYDPAAANFFKGMLDATNKYSPCYRGATQRFVIVSP